MERALPPNILWLFQPRCPLKYLPPDDYPPEDRRTRNITGVAAYLEELHNPERTYLPSESLMQKHDRIQLAKKAAKEERLKEAIEKYDPRNDPNAIGDPHKTLFVYGLANAVSKIELVFLLSRFGEIDQARIVRHTLTGRSRGYAFVAFSNVREMEDALKHASDFSIQGRILKADIERGRIESGWKPRRLGGGLGGKRSQRAEVPDSASLSHRPRSRDAESTRGQPIGIENSQNGMGDRTRRGTAGAARRGNRGQGSGQRGSRVQRGSRGQRAQENGHNRQRGQARQEAIRANGGYGDQYPGPFQYLGPPMYPGPPQHHGPPQHYGPPQHPGPPQYWAPLQQPNPPEQTRPPPHLGNSQNPGHTLYPGPTQRFSPSQYFTSGPFYQQNSPMYSDPGPDYVREQFYLRGQYYRRYVRQGGDRRGGPSRVGESWGGEGQDGGGALGQALQPVTTEYRASVESGAESEFKGGAKSEVKGGAEGREVGHEVDHGADHGVEDEIKSKAESDVESAGSAESKIILEERYSSLRGQDRCVRQRIHRRTQSI